MILETITNPEKSPLKPKPSLKRVIKMSMNTKSCIFDLTECANFGVSKHYFLD